MASKHSVFPLTEVSTFPEKIHPKRSDFRGQHIVKTVLAARPWLYGVIMSDLKFMERRKTWNWLGILHKVSKIYFFPSNYPLHYRQSHHFRVWSNLWLKTKSSRGGITQSGRYKACRKPFGQNLLDAMMSQKHGQAAEYCSKWWQRCSNFGLFLEKFHDENLHFRGCNFGEWLIIVQGYY